MKKPINPKELENDMNKILSFIGNLENLDIENDVNKLLSFLDSIDSLDIENTDFNKLEKDVKTFKEDIETKYKDHLDDQE